MYTNAPYVRLAVNGKPAVGGELTAVPYFGAAVFPAVAFAAGTLTADAVGADRKTVLGSHSVRTPLADVAAVVLSVVAPSPQTGTGDALVADGQDVAMVSATLVDAAGEPVTSGAAASRNITFTVVKGSGRLLAMHSGTPYPAVDSIEPTIAAHRGVVMAFIRSTEVKLGTAADRALLKTVHMDAGRGGSAAIYTGSHYTDAGGADDIVVQASADGVKEPAFITIPVTSDSTQLPLAVAKRSVAEAIAARKKQ